MRCKNRESALDIAVGLTSAGMLFCSLVGCGSSGGSPDVADAGPGSKAEVGADRSADVSLLTDASSAPDAEPVMSFCIDPAPQALIDDMSGSSISLTPPSCGTTGAWNTAFYGGDPGSFGTFTVPDGKGHPLYGPLPAGFPGPIATALDGGAPAPRAVCVAGQTGASLDNGAGTYLTLGDTGWPPKTLIDASEYGGIQFWLWVSPSTAEAVSSSFRVFLIDKNQLPLGGVCDRYATGATACAVAQAAPSHSVADEAQAAGPLLADDGSEITDLSRGWQHVLAPWSSFLANPQWGGANEAMVDPRTLAEVDFLVAKDHADGGAIPFDFCIYQLSFLPKPQVPALDGGALGAVD
jgi:hypothetical protein